jgi:hypothetical protein
VGGGEKTNFGLGLGLGLGNGLGLEEGSDSGLYLPLARGFIKSHNSPYVCNRVSPSYIGSSALKLSPPPVPCFPTERNETL